MPLHPQPPLTIDFSIGVSGFEVGLPQLGICASGVTEGEATEKLVELARSYMVDYLANSELYFFQLDGAAPLPYVLAMQTADEAGELHEYLLGESLPGC